VITSVDHTAEVASLVERIERLHRVRKAVVLAYNQQLSEVQDVTNYVGDSPGLSRQAAATDAEVIVFCGVHCMA
jgi:quinolinate synthase